VRRRRDDHRPDDHCRRRLDALTGGESYGRANQIGDLHRLRLTLVLSQYRAYWSRRTLLCAIIPQQIGSYVY
jgi:hypothetical protein